jgi:multidrug resistance efflux pump
MSQVELKPEPIGMKSESRGAPAPPPLPRVADARPYIRFIPIVITLVMVAIAALFTWAMWRTYMEAPWTRDGTVRVYVVTMAPEVAGRIVDLPVADNQYVHKGELLMVIDPTNYEIAVHQAEAAVQQTKAIAQNAEAQATRRRKQTNLSVSDEEKANFVSSAQSAEAAYQQALANLDLARANLERTRIVSPVNGYVTNLLTQLGDYVDVGEKNLSVINADSFWVDGYFEETNLEHIREGDAAMIKLMGYHQVIRGHVDSVARGINVANAQPDTSGLASVNPIFTWVRLAQRVPVRIHIDEVPEGVRLAAGMTATVQIVTAPEQGTSLRSLILRWYDLVL